MPIPSIPVFSAHVPLRFPQIFPGSATEFAEESAEKSAPSHGIFFKMPASSAYLAKNAKPALEGQETTGFAADASISPPDLTFSVLSDAETAAADAIFSAAIFADTMFSDAALAETAFAETILSTATFRISALLFSAESATPKCDPDGCFSAEFASRTAGRFEGGFEGESAVAFAASLSESADPKDSVCGNSV